MHWQKHELTYCANVHPGTGFSDVKENISAHIASVARKRQLRQMSVGLWLSCRCVEELQQSQDKCNELYALLEQHNLYLGTLNGFPYGDFHQSVVKQKVYLPTWADPSRLAYTVALAHILAESPHPDHAYASTLVEKTISTLPLAYADGWQAEHTTQACVHLCMLVTELDKIHQRTGVRIRVCLEMEPDCVLESTSQLVRFFQYDLLAQAKHLALPEELIFNYLGCCYDTCHQAVMGEDIEASLSSILDAGIHIGKIQVSNAPNVLLENEHDILDFCAAFEEKKFLHQVKIGQSPGGVYQFPDLNCTSLIELYRQHERFNHSECRVHFHVPVHLYEMQLMRDIKRASSGCLVVSTTQSVILQVLSYLRQNKDRFLVKPFLEIETYTWQQFLGQSISDKHMLEKPVVQEKLVEKKELKKKNASAFDIVDGLVTELDWLEQEMHKLSLISE